MVDRRRLATGVLALGALALIALMAPVLASARVAYFTGSSSGEIGAPVELSTQIANSANQVVVGMSAEGMPEDVAITPDGRTAYVVGNDHVTPIDVATNKAGTPIPVPLFGHAIAITPDGRFAYVTSAFSMPSAVTKIDLAANTVAATIPVGEDLFGVAVTPDGRTAYVVSSEDGRVYPIDVATNVVGAPIVVGTFPQAIAVTPDGTRAYAHSVGEQKLTGIDLATNTVTGSIPNVPGTDLAIGPNSAKAYVVGNEVTAVNLAAGTAGTPQSPSTPQSSFPDVSFLPDGSRAYMTTQVFQSSLGEGLMTPIATAGDALQPTFPLNAPFVRALAIVPNQPPRADFSVSPQTSKATQPVSFDAGASADTDGGSVVRYDWDFGDGSSAANAGPTPQHTYEKPGTYTVTLTVTDNEGCSVATVFPGQTAYCNGSSIARTTRTVVVERNLCPQVKAGASTFIPKRRPGNVLPGVRVMLSTGVPAKLTVTARLVYRQNGKEASAKLGTISVTVNKWRRVRFAVPPELRQELPLGKRVKVELRIETEPKGGAPCETTVVNRTLNVHVVKVFPNRVQAERPR